jgi:hypothetical protein
MTDDSKAQEPQGLTDDQKRALMIARDAQAFEGERTHLGNLVYVGDLVWALDILSAALSASAPPQPAQPEDGK